MSLSSEIIAGYLDGRTVEVALLLNGKEIGAYQRGSVTFRAVAGGVRGVAQFAPFPKGATFDAICLVLSGALSDPQPYPAPFHLPPDTVFTDEMTVRG